MRVFLRNFYPLLEVLFFFSPNLTGNLPCGYRYHTLRCQRAQDIEGEVVLGTIFPDLSNTYYIWALKIKKVELYHSIYRAKEGGHSLLRFIGVSEVVY